MSLGNRELLSHASFSLQRGRHYVLHGKNGIGKSTLLRAIATDQIPSIPRGVKVLLLGQTESNFENELAKLDISADTAEPTVLEYVLRSDKDRERLMKEEALLSTAIEAAATDPMAGVRAYRKVSLDRLQRERDQARQIQLLRSDGRGAQFRKVLLKLEEDLRVAEASLDDEVGPAEMADESQKAAEMLGEVQTSLELVSMVTRAQDNRNRRSADVTSDGRFCIGGESTHSTAWSRLLPRQYQSTALASIRRLAYAM
jgi:ATPase subunit of ABC transporter with duplicated ATPase domains